MPILEIEIDDSGPVTVQCTEADLIGDLADGRRVATPLWWYLRLAAPTSADRMQAELSFLGGHWPTLDKDLSVAGMPRGAKARGATPPEDRA